MQYESGSRFVSLSLPNVAFFYGSTSGSKLSSLQSFISSSNQPITNNAHGLHGLIETTNALSQGVLGSIEFCNFGATNSIGTFANPSAFASIFATRGPLAFGEPTKKRKKR
jgi:hypothetical protein